MRNPRRPWNLPVSGGALGRLGADFLRDLGQDYRTHGAAMIANFRKNEPWNYLRLLLSVASREPLEETDGPESLSDLELNSLIRIARAELAKFEREERQTEPG